MRGLQAPVKVDVCHRVGNGEYKLLSVNGDKVGCGDWLPGDEVPDMTGFTFNENCCAFGLIAPTSYSASSDDYSVSFAFDGCKRQESSCDDEEGCECESTRWWQSRLTECSGCSCTPPAEDQDQWLEVDLGDIYQVEKVTIYWERAAAEIYEIQVSIDGHLLLQFGVLRMGLLVLDK